LRETNLINSLLSAAQPEALLLVTAIAFYLVGLLVGRILKRQLAVGLGWTYQIFLISAAIAGASAWFHIDFPGQHLIGLVALFFCRISAERAALPLLLAHLWIPRRTSADSSVLTADHDTSSDRDDIFLPG